MKHTGKKWIYSPHMGDLTIRTDDGTKYHGTINICNVFDHPQRPGEAEANAKLIASAPELLEACEWALSELAEPETSSADTLHETIERLKTAIKKATT